MSINGETSPLHLLTRLSFLPVPIFGFPVDWIRGGPDDLGVTLGRAVAWISGVGTSESAVLVHAPSAYCIFSREPRSHPLRRLEIRRQFANTGAMQP
jgi:hypothetical protein